METKRTTTPEITEMLRFYQAAAVRQSTSKLRARESAHTGMSRQEQPMSDRTMDRSNPRRSLRLDNDGSPTTGGATYNLGGLPPPIAGEKQDAWALAVRHTF